ncbi:hypothetical protein [Burkholderia pseudomallei]|uniref:Uncharacterized protein n=1 Tax=Burkholderia pseudomallei (strain K96243) TaxID=272560 RepID=Q63W33_BURPS|nr:hypothetical protein [Burkholderia pseudomallei]ARL51459.1 hypothetical protein BOC51_17020 [Burkholderia pseudomallei]EIF68705.1 hypothetical protein BP354E_6111 [Burkholderia pseudomallei 354e]EIF72964.1 hypothetical protein BP354A_5890 [Burkholderia pseudomallei 354a]KIX58763.1 hypothetical protein SZ29_09785 [Burkholderia pseudomallei]MBD2913088.1 hypothetical protein [Burkholderia pseudomallei]
MARNRVSAEIAVRMDEIPRWHGAWTSCLPVLYWPPSENASNCRYCVFLTFRVVRALFIGARARVRFGLMAGNVGGTPAWRLPFAQAPHLQDTPSETATRT